MSAPLWKPSEETIRRANLTRFFRHVEKEHRESISDYPSLYRWSLDKPDRFWASLWTFAQVRSGKLWDQVLVDPRRMPGAKWFAGAELNFAENLLRRRDSSPALIFCSETGLRREFSYAEVYKQVGCIARWLRRAGVQPGDRVVAFMPNLPETIIAMLGAASLGAVWSGCSPDFGLKGVLDRFGQIAPRILFTAESYSYNGKAIDCMERVRGLAQQVPSIEKVVVVPYLNPKPSLEGLPQAEMWEELMSGEPAPLEFKHLPFDHPLYILYSSGTTGIPKCLVHGAGGTLLQHLKEHQLHVDLKPGERIFYFTTCGWMMWNWLVTALGSEATLILYDGAPMHPTPETLWELAEQEKVNVFGTSAGYLAAVEKAGLEPARTHDFSALRAILSTGSPLAPRSFDYVYQKIKEDLLLASISGGTDIVSCFALGNPIGPVYRSEIQTRGLGMKVEIYNDEGKPVRGEKGELVCTAPFPSMPVSFWNDPDGGKYRSAYFEHFPGVWRHGDYAELTEHDGMIIYGRSDAVLNPHGVRIGTAEIYRQVESFSEVLESLVVGQEWEGNVRVVLFVRLRDGLVLDDALRKRIATQIRSNTTPRHVPAKIIQVSEIPKTISGKIVELAVREVIHNRPVKNAAAFANPKALDLFKDLPELKT